MSAPTTRQLNYLRSLALKTGETFATPRTSAEASREIDRLKGRVRPALAHRLERVTTERAAVHGLPTMAGYRDDEITGYGSNATWSSPAWDEEA